MQVFDYKELNSVDLMVDAIYEGGGKAVRLGDPISKLLPGSGNLGGFRIAGIGPHKKFVVLFTTGEDKDWPDVIDLNTGQFTYFGDNKVPGRVIRTTKPGGNLLLERVFECLHSLPARRAEIPPFFVFSKCPTPGSGRSVQFKGLAVPGFPGVTANDDLVAVWKTSANQRFQNYRSVFTILDCATVSRKWIFDLAAGQPQSENAPKVWLKWMRSGAYEPLTATPTTVIRNVDQQSPRNRDHERILELIYDYFCEAPLLFEAFSAKIFQMVDRRVVIDEITRGSVDGGRDAIGRYLLGLPNDPVYVDFALEAKCYRPKLDGRSLVAVGVKELSRLISRLRHRQFGVLVTTSIVGRQAYSEVREDKHPIIIISGQDIVEILVQHGFNTPKSVEQWLGSEFPI